ncbi:MAG: ABC transporter permease [Thaumarchaeota archaeon]|nr:ABC transporter permease [Candidatus Calditenuaceae archaeon]MDW8187496.1 ABC transporter permease [Nitrososphaerota archaeon]
MFRRLLSRALTLTAVLITVLTLLTVVLGATGYSDRIIQSLIGEQLRSMRESLAQRIRDPEELERALSGLKSEMERAYGLDRPWYTRIPETVLRVLTLDLGDSRTARSTTGSTKVIDVLSERIPNTVVLVTTAMLISSLLGLYIGATLSKRVGTRLERSVTYLSAVSNSLPSWWTGILLLIVFAYQLRLFPGSGMFSSPPPEGALERAIDVLWHSVLPVTTLVLISIGPSIYASRTLLLNVAQEDFVSVARSKGLPERVVSLRYVLRPASPPIVTGLALSLPASLGGAILTETVFNWPGMGRLYYNAVIMGDEVLIVALTYLFTLMYVVARFILEVLYHLLDPRVRV